VGPLWFFSDAGGFVAPNPVQSAFISFAFVITKDLTNLINEDINSSTIKKDDFSQNTFGFDDYT